MKSIFLSIFLLSAISTFSNEKYPILEEEIFDTPFIYIGSSPRETIVYNHQSSLFLDHYVDEFLSKITLHLPTQSLFNALMKCILYHIFDPHLCNEKQTDVLIMHQCSTSLSFPEIPLEIFLKARTGVCRHIALCTSLFIDKLIHKGILQGKVFLIRAMTPYGRHAWVVYLSKESIWFIDPYWRVLENAKIPEGWQTLCRTYGIEIMEQQKKQWNLE